MLNRYDIIMIDLRDMKEKVATDALAETPFQAMEIAQILADLLGIPAEIRSAELVEENVLHE